MAEPKDMIVPMLLELRDEMRRSFANAEHRSEQRFAEVERRLERIEKRQDAQKDAFAGESVLARYAAKGVDERLDSLERDVAVLRAER